MSSVGAVPRRFVPPPYPYDRLDELANVASAHPGGMVDLSIGTPCDPPPKVVVEVLGASGAERGYPTSVGSAGFRESASGWMRRRFGVEVDPQAVAGCVGTKEFVASLATYLRLRAPEKDTVLYPEIAYPTYEMSAQLAGGRAVGVPQRPGGGLELGAVSDSDAARALVLWVNSPANPSGGLTDLEEAARWGRSRDVLVVSDECYVEFTWNGPPKTILSSGSDGVIALHSLSKRSNMAGCRVGFFAGDAPTVSFLASVRRHAGLMIPGPVQAAASAALDDDEHVEIQRAVYRRRLELLAGVLEASGLEVPLPDGAFYLWLPVPGWAKAAAGAHVGSGSGAWVLARALAQAGGMLVGPGDLYGPGADHVRIAVVQPDARLELVASRMAARPGLGEDPGLGERE
jgi:succinyldiaminopimelate transaminase